MEHKIRQNGQITYIDCQLASGFRDKNGTEIFEGDSVLHHENVISTIEFLNGALCLDRSPLAFYDTTTLTVISKDAKRHSP